MPAKMTGGIALNYLRSIQDANPSKTSADSGLLRVMVHVKDYSERWIIMAHLQHVRAQEVDDVSRIRAAVDRQEADLVIADAEEGASGYWLRHILENQLAPVIVLVDQDDEYTMPEIYRQVPAISLSRARLSRDDVLQTVDATMARWQAIQRNVVQKAELERLANHDALTGLFNRRAVLSRLRESMARASEHGEQVSVLILDMDRFGKIETVLGRSGADALLMRIASLLQIRMRESDIVGRYGGDAFLIVLPHTDVDGAKIAAERIRSMVETLEVADLKDTWYSVTVSGGLAAYQAGDDIAVLTYRAEANLCRAKERGRNRVEK